MKNQQPIIIESKIQKKNGKIYIDQNSDCNCSIILMGQIENVQKYTSIQ